MQKALANMGDALLQNTPESSRVTSFNIATVLLWASRNMVVTRGPYADPEIVKEYLKQDLENKGIDTEDFIARARKMIAKHKESEVEE